MALVLFLFSLFFLWGLQVAIRGIQALQTQRRWSQKPFLVVFTTKIQIFSIIYMADLILILISGYKM